MNAFEFTLGALLNIIISLSMRTNRDNFYGCLFK